MGATAGGAFGPEGATGKCGLIAECIFDIPGTPGGLCLIAEGLANGVLLGPKPGGTSALGLKGVTGAFGFDWNCRLHPVILGGELLTLSKCDLFGSNPRGAGAFGFIGVIGASCLLTTFPGGLLI